MEKSFIFLYEISSNLYFSETRDTLMAKDRLARIELSLSVEC